jgi:hypothetical protein
MVIEIGFVAGCTSTRSAHEAGSDGAGHAA